MRLQLALNVTNLDRAVEYYTHLFGVSPHKRRPGYANFKIDKPALKLVLFENPSAKERINHLGVEVDTRQELDEAMARLASKGLADSIEEDSTCCHATQDKVWSSEPDGLDWEWYRITDDAPLTPSGACC